MKTLTDIGRKNICKRFGIVDKDSIFIKDKDAFVDRMSLYNRIYNVQMLIDVYKDEMQEFETEEAYNEFLNNCTNKLVDTITELTYVANDGECPYCSGCMIEDEEKDFGEGCFLRIYFRSPMFEGFRYMCSETVDIEDNIYDFIYNNTESRFLALARDLDLNDIKDTYVRDVIKRWCFELSSYMLNLISPMHLNAREIVHVGHSEVYFMASENKSASSLENIINTLTKEENNIELVNIELYKSYALAEGNPIKRKVPIAGGDDESIGLMNYDELTLINYLRKSSNEIPTKYDRYFNYKGAEACLGKDIKVRWYD